MNKQDENRNLATAAVFLTGLTTLGNELLEFFPESDFCEDIDNELCLKSMPMGGKDKDSIVTNVNDNQAVCIMRSIPGFESPSEKRDMYVSLGLLIPKGRNPIPYQNILTKLTDQFDAKGILNKRTLTRIVPNLFHILNRIKKSEELLTQF